MHNLYIFSGDHDRRPRLNGSIASQHASVDGPKRLPTLIVKTNPFIGMSISTKYTDQPIGSGSDCQYRDAARQLQDVKELKRSGGKYYLGSFTRFAIPTSPPARLFRIWRRPRAERFGPLPHRELHTRRSCVAGPHSSSFLSSSRRTGPGTEPFVLLSLPTGPLSAASRSCALR